MLTVNCRVHLSDGTSIVIAMITDKVEDRLIANLNVSDKVLILLLESTFGRIGPLV